MYTTTKPAARQVDAAAVKDAARGRWREILTSLGGIDAALLDGKHHPCPLCGGRDRFRMIGADDGALLCNQCFRKDNGDGLAALRWLKGWTFPEAVRAVAEYLGVAGGNGRAPRPAATTPRATPRGRAYRSLDEAIGALSLTRGKPAKLWKYDDADGNLVGAVARWNGRDGKTIRPLARDADGMWRVEAMPAPRPLYQLPELLGEAEATVWVAEGEKCADALAGLGLTATTSSGGARAASQTDWTALAGRRVVVLPDNDDAGKAYAADVARLATEAGAAEVRILELADYAPGLGDGGDVADIIDAPDFCGLAGESATADDLRCRLETLAGAAPTWRPPVPELELTIAPVKGTTATVTAKRGDDVLHVERLDLGKPKARAGFLDALAERAPDANRAALENELLNHAARLAASGGRDEAAATGEETDAFIIGARELAATPSDIVAEARTMLESPELLRRVALDIEALGVAGERALALTVYLVLTSRLLSRPLSAIVQGPSSSGKSYIVETVARLFPDEAVVRATQMTPQALFHLPSGALVHRAIVSGERSRKEDDDTAEATRALREMIGSGKLSKLMPMKVDGEIRTVTIEQPGPVAYIETTTLQSIFDEDANRCLLLATDERAEQTRRILDALAAEYAGGVSARDIERIIARHHAAQRLLQRLDVVVPFSNHLAAAIPDERVQARRAFPQVIGMVQTIALLNQRQRQRDEAGRVVAELDDYAVARRLLAGPMGRALGGAVSDSAIRFHQRLMEWFGGGDFTTRDAKVREKGSPRSVRGWLAELHDAGGVSLVEASRGRAPSRWHVEPLSAEELAGALLPAIDEGDSALPACQQDVSACGA